MTKVFTRSGRRSLIWLVYLGMACRAVVPVGYMPAALSDGGPVVLCHGGLAGNFLAQLGTPATVHPGETDLGDSHHSSPHDEAGQQTNGHTGAWELCPMGAALGGVALTAEFDIAVLILAEQAPPAELTAFSTNDFLALYWPRAPPKIHSTVA